MRISVRLSRTENGKREKKREISFPVPVRELKNFPYGKLALKMDGKTGTGNPVGRTLMRMFNDMKSFGSSTSV